MPKLLGSCKCASHNTNTVHYKISTGVPNLRSGKFSSCFLKTNQPTACECKFPRVCVSFHASSSHFFPYLAVMRFDLINFFFNRPLGRRPYVVLLVGVRRPTLRNHEWTVCSDEWKQQTDLLPVSIESGARLWQCTKGLLVRDLNF